MSKVAATTISLPLFSYSFFFYIFLLFGCVCISVCVCLPCVFERSQKGEKEERERAIMGQCTTKSNASGVQSKAEAPDLSHRQGTAAVSSSPKKKTGLDARTTMMPPPSTGAAAAPSDGATCIVKSKDGAFIDAPLLPSAAIAHTLSNRLSEGSTHVWLLPSWKNPHLETAPLLPLHVPYLSAVTTKMASSATAVAALSGSTLAATPATRTASGLKARSTSGAASVGLPVPLTSPRSPLSSPLTSPSRSVLEGVENIHGVARGALIVHRPGEITGSEVTITASEGASFVFMTQMQKVSISDCSHCFFFIGPTKTTVSLVRCTHCVVVVIANTLELNSCESMLCIAHTTGLPVLTHSDDILIGAFSSWFAYNELPLHLRAAGMSPFINNFSTVLDRTPPTRVADANTGPSSGGGAASGSRTTPTLTSAPPHVSPHSPHYHCITSFALDLILYELWIRVTHAKAIRADAEAAVEARTPTSPQESQSSPDTAAEKEKETLAVYCLARDEWRAELDTFHSALPRASPQGTHTNHVKDLAREREEEGEEKEEQKEKEEKAAMVKGDATAGVSPRRSMSLSPVWHLYASSFMTPMEWKLRRHFISAPVVFLSSVVAASEEEVEGVRGGRRCSEAKNSHQAAKDQTTTAVQPVTTTTTAVAAAATLSTPELYRRLRDALRVRDAALQHLTPPYTPRSLDDVRCLYGHVTVLPATLGAQTIPAECFHQRWRLKLLVTTAKCGGWAVARRVVADVDTYRRKALLTTMASLGQRKTRRGGTANGGDDAEDEEEDNDASSAASLTDTALRDVRARYGPIILLNTAELRCSDVIVREYVAPTFYHLTEPLEVRQQQQQQRDSHHLPRVRLLAHGAHDTKNVAKNPDGGEDENEVDGHADKGFLGRATQRLFRRRHEEGLHNEARGGDMGAEEIHDDQRHTTDSDAEQQQQPEAQGRDVGRAQPRTTTADSARREANNGGGDGAAGRSSANADDVARHLVDMRRLFGQAIQRMSGQTCVLVLALVAPAPLTAMMDVPQKDAHTRTRPNRPEEEETAAVRSGKNASCAPATRVTRCTRVALESGLPTDPADVFQPLTRAREHVLQLAQDTFERQQSVLRPFLSAEATHVTSHEGAVAVEDVVVGDDAAEDKASTTCTTRTANRPAPLTSAGTDSGFQSCRESAVQTPSTPYPSAQSGKFDCESSQLNRADKPEWQSVVMPSRQAVKQATTVPQPSPHAPSRPPQATPDAAAAAAVSDAVEASPTMRGPSKEASVWPNCVVLNVTLPLRFVTVLQANIFFKGCVSSHQIASAKSSLQSHNR